MPRAVPLTQGYVALVDDEDFESIACFKWRIKRFPGGLMYAIRSVHVGYKQYRNVLMHREIMQCKDWIDHKDGNGINNQRANMRPATSSQNQANRTKKRATSKSPYKGVYWSKQKSKWGALITRDGIQIHLGLFKEECDAALAYNIKADELSGEFTKYNIPIQREAA